MKKILLTTTVLLAGLMAYAAEHPMDMMFKTWIGTPIKSTIKEWGDPSDIVYKRGQREYKWITSGTRFIPGTMFEERTMCERKLIVDVKGKIVYGTFTGNGCPFTRESVKRWNNPNFDYMQDMINSDYQN